LKLYVAFLRREITPTKFLQEEAQPRKGDLAMEEARGIEARRVLRTDALGRVVFDPHWKQGLASCRSNKLGLLTPAKSTPELFEYAEDRVDENLATRVHAKFGTRRFSGCQQRRSLVSGNRVGAVIDENASNVGTAQVRSGNGTGSDRCVGS
jgi:hypothetical protein